MRTDEAGVDSHGIKGAELDLQPVQPVSEAGEYLWSCPCQNSSSHTARRLHISFHTTPNSGVSSGARHETLTSAENLHNQLLSNCQSKNEPTPVFITFTLKFLHIFLHSLRLWIKIFTKHTFAEPSTQPRLTSNLAHDLRTNFSTFQMREHSCQSHVCPHWIILYVHVWWRISQDGNQFQQQTNHSLSQKTMYLWKLLVSVATKCECLIECNNALWTIWAKCIMYGI